MLEVETHALSRYTGSLNNTLFPDGRSRLHRIAGPRAGGSFVIDRATIDDPTMEKTRDRPLPSLNRGARLFTSERLLLTNDTHIRNTSVSKSRGSFASFETPKPAIRAMRVNVRFQVTVKVTGLRSRDTVRQCSDWCVATVLFARQESRDFYHCRDSNMNIFDSRTTGFVISRVRDR